MKACIDDGGFLAVEPESSTEAYALLMWVKENHMATFDCDDPSVEQSLMLTVVTEVEKES